MAELQFKRNKRPGLRNPYKKTLDPLYRIHLFSIDNLSKKICSGFGALVANTHNASRCIRSEDSAQLKKHYSSTKEIPLLPLFYLLTFRAVSSTKCLAPLDGGYGLSMNFSQSLSKRGPLSSVDSVRGHAKRVSNASSSQLDAAGRVHRLSSLAEEC